MAEGHTGRPLLITGLLSTANDGSVDDRRWKDVGIRVRCLEIARHLGALGQTLKLVESLNAPRRMADGSFFDSDIYVIYQALEDHRPYVSALLDAGKCVVTDVCDDAAQYRGLLGHTWENAQRAHGITVPTRSLAERLAVRTATPIHVVPDAVEGAPRPVRLPRADGPLRLFWYGWQHKIGVLADRLPALAGLAERRPVELALMTNMDPVQPVLRDILDSSRPGLSIRAEPWSFDAFNATMEQADIAIIPYDDSVSYSGRSPVRLIQAAWQGRLAISEDVDGYPEFARFGLLHASLIDGLEWAIGNPAAVERALHDVRRYVAETYHPAVLARFWLRALTDIHRRFEASRDGDRA